MPRGIEYGGLSIASQKEAARSLARAASVLLKSSPKKRIHADNISLTLGVSGQFCTNWISTGEESGHYQTHGNASV
jgi:hypothetical protein